MQMDERFKRLTKQQGECLIWMGKRDSAGWGTLSTPIDLRPYYGPVERRAASWVAAWDAGLEHPDELDKDNLVLPSCGNKLCVSIEHVLRSAMHAPREAPEQPPRLAVVPQTAKEASKPKPQTRTKRTGCISGHSYSEFGILRSDGYYRCKICHREANNRYKREGVKLGPKDPCMNGHGAEFKREARNGEKVYTYCSECKSESAKKRNAILAWRHVSQPEPETAS